MKGYLVTVTFLDGSKEGVFFSDKSDANQAVNYRHADFDGSSIAINWVETYGDSGLPMTIQEIEV